MEMLRYLKRSLLKMVYKTYLWSTTERGVTRIFHISERIIEYPFAIESVMSLPKGSKIAILGCHGDLLTTILPTLGYEVSGVDVKSFPLRRENFHFYQGDVRKTNFEDNFFDAVIGISTIEHVGLFDDDQNGDKKTVAEMRRILKPGGTCVITVPFGKKHTEIPMLQRIYDERSLKDMLAGLEVNNLFLYGLNEGGTWETVNPESVPEAKHTVECVALVRATKHGSEAE